MFLRFFYGGTADHAGKIKEKIHSLIAGLHNINAFLV